MTRAEVISGRRQTVGRFLALMGFGAIIYLVAMVVLAFASPATCGSMSTGLCVITLMGSAGSLLSGIGILFLIWEATKALRFARAQAELQAREKTNRKEAALEAVDVIQHRIGLAAGRIANSPEGADLRGILARQPPTPVAAQIDNLRQLRNLAERFGVPRPKDVIALDEALRMFELSVEGRLDPSSDGRERAQRYWGSKIGEALSAVREGIHEVQR